MSRRSLADLEAQYRETLGGTLRPAPAPEPVRHFTFVVGHPVASGEVVRAGTLLVRLPEPILGGASGWFAYDEDPGSGPMAYPLPISSVVILDGPLDGLVALADWAQESWAYSAGHAPGATGWIRGYALWADHVAELAQRAAVAARLA